MTSGTTDAVKTIGKIEEPHIREAIFEIAAKAEGHIGKIHQLFRIIERDPFQYAQYAGMTLARLKKGIEELQGMFGGVPGDWKLLHQLYLLNMNAQGGLCGYGTIRFTSWNARNGQYRTWCGTRKTNRPVGYTGVHDGNGLHLHYL